MNRRVPYEKYFKTAKKFSSIQKIFFSLSFIVSVIMPFFSDKFTEVTKVGTFISSAFLIALFILDYLVKYNQNRGENLRREDFWDNSFGTKLNENPTELYYTNDNIGFGLQKCIYNICENTVHSLNTTNVMMKQSLQKLIILGSILFIFIFIGLFNNTLGLIILQIFLSKYIVVDFLDLMAYKKQLEYVKEKIKDLLASNINPDSIDYQIKVIYSLLVYECNISHLNILLDSKIFDKYNEEISKEWNEFKKRYPAKVGVKNDSK